jgi:hypothetical protein
MRADRLRFLPTALLVLALPVSALADGPWKERYEIEIPLTLGLPTDAERYAKAEVLYTQRDKFADPSCPGSPDPECALVVFPWETACLERPPVGPCVEVELCEEATPFYGQPTPNRDCSGFLVGEDLILTAGHCVNCPLCENMVFVFDYAVESEVDSLGEPAPTGRHGVHPAGGHLHLRRYPRNGIPLSRWNRPG